MGYDEDYYKQIINKIFDDEWLQESLFYESHALNEHLTSDENLIKRMFNEKKTSVSTFENLEDAKEMIIDGVMDSQEVIAAWVCDGRIKYDKLQEIAPAYTKVESFDNHKLVLNIDMDRNVGYGYQNDFKKYESPIMTICLRRASINAPFHDLGFNLTTAYCDITHSLAVDTQEVFDLSEMDLSFIQDDEIKELAEKMSFIQETTTYPAALNIKNKYLQVAYPDGTQLSMKANSYRVKAPGENDWIPRKTYQGRYKDTFEKLYLYHSKNKLNEVLKNIDTKYKNEKEARQDKQKERVHEKLTR